MVNADGPLSPDGQWRWDGQRWNPKDVPPVAASSRRLAFLVIGWVLVVVAFVGGLIATAVASWVHSVCNDDAATVNGHRQALRLDVVFIWLVVTCVPILFAVVAKGRNRRIWPWTVSVGVCVAVAIAIELSIQPSTWCLY